jgi:molecular chaperone DnaJ
MSERSCSKCQGTGQSPEQACAHCGGRALERLTEKRSLAIPAGADHGSTHVVRRAGHRLAPGGTVGKLEVTLVVRPHPFFERIGNDIRCRVPITIAQAALGDRIEVPTLSGKIRLSVPRATQPGAVLRVRGKGLPHRVRSGNGDQLVEVVVEVPTHLSPRAEQLLSELASELEGEVQPERKSFLGKLKSFLEG